jgi:hypothetical protein
MKGREFHEAFEEPDHSRVSLTSYWKMSHGAEGKESEAHVVRSAGIEKYHPD